MHPCWEEVSHLPERERGRGRDEEDVGNPREGMAFADTSVEIRLHDISLLW